MDDREVALIIGSINTIENYSSIIANSIDTLTIQEIKHMAEEMNALAQHLQKYNH